MTLSSMTGFARVGGGQDAFTWTWELRSVNGRGLDLRCRLPAGYEALEVAVRAAAAKRLARGSTSINLRVNRSGGDVAIRIDEEVLAQLVQIARKYRDELPDAGLSIDGLLGIRGVTEVVEVAESEAALAEREQAMLRDFDTALDGLIDMRQGEGAQLAAILERQLEAMAGCVARAGASAEMQSGAIAERIETQIAALVDRPDALSDERLAQEAAILAAKADVREELDRLTAHIEAALELLSGAEPVGRRLDFLAQEFNREANTLVSKSADMELTRVGLDLKVIIDQFREQVQNIE